MTQLVAFSVEYDGPCKLAGTAILEERVRVGKDCEIGHYVYVMEDTVLGKEVVLDYLVRTGERCKIGVVSIIRGGVGAGQLGLTISVQTNYAPSCLAPTF